MARYIVLKMVDSMVHYTTEIEAETPKQAAELALKNVNECHWKHVGVDEGDTCIIKTLDDAGEPIDATMVYL